MGCFAKSKFVPISGLNRFSFFFKKCGYSEFFLILRTLLFYQNPFLKKEKKKKDPVLIISGPKVGISNSAISYPE